MPPLAVAHGQHPVIYFGTGIVGSSNVPALQDAETLSALLDAVRDVGISQIDTAARYPADNQGGSERMLGLVGSPAKGFTINTKVLVSGNSSAGSLSRDAVRASVANSLASLGIAKVGILYAHAADEATPLEEQAAALDEQFRNGSCEKIGLSNFPLEMIERFVAICAERDYEMPSVYQGQYNLICREPETGLLPLLRKHNMAFDAYSPLGGGFLTGKLTTGQADGTRLASAYGQHFRAWYDKPQFHDAIRSLLAVVEPLDISPTGAALRWLAYHSALGEKDGIILGATTPQQIQQNMADINRGPLPDEVVDEIERLRETIEQANGSFAVNLASLPTSK